MWFVGVRARITKGSGREESPWYAVLHVLVVSNEARAGSLGMP